MQRDGSNLLPGILTSLHPWLPFAYAENFELRFLSLQGFAEFVYQRSESRYVSAIVGVNVVGTLAVVPKNLRKILLTISKFDFEGGAAVADEAAYPVWIGLGLRPTWSSAVSRKLETTQK